LLWQCADLSGQSLFTSSLSNAWSDDETLDDLSVLIFGTQYPGLLFCRGPDGDVPNESSEPHPFAKDDSEIGGYTG
jgi:hypothetical protein